jgi:hypothetical protein
MAINKYTRSSRFSPDTTDPDTGFRIANPDKMGKISPQGSSMVTSWPELREAYKRGELPSDLLTGGRGDIPQDVISYMKGETNKLSERYAEPEYFINPDTQKVSTIRNIGDPGYKVGDTLTDKPSEAGKKNVGFLRYAADNPANKAMINRRRSYAKSYGYDLKDVIQGDSVAAGQSDSPYSEEEMAALYPDMQIGAGDIMGMSNFGQSAYRESNAQRKKRIKQEEDIVIFNKKEAEAKAKMAEGPVRMAIRDAELPGGNYPTKIVGATDRPDYKDPAKPFIEFKPGGKPKLKGDSRKTQRKQNRELFFQNLGKGKNKLKAPKQERTYGRFENLGEKRKYRQEEKLAKSTYGRGLEQKSEGELDERKAILKERKREQMKGGNFFKNLAVNQSARREIRDINRAKKYSKMVGGEQRVGISDRSLTDNQKKGGPQYFTPEQMTGYRDSKSNPLNRNSVASRFKR